MNAARVSRRFEHTAVLAAGLVVIGWTYRQTLLAMTDKWRSDAAFSHCILVLPVSLWLIWRQRHRLAGMTPAASWLGIAALLGCNLGWFIGRGTGVLVVEQFAVIGILLSFVLAVLGWPMVRTILFPLTFLFFVVPFGRGIVPLLMQQTADVAAFVLRLTGIPVYQSYMHLSIPGGSFEVARACSGLNFFLTGLVLGTLYAYLSFNSLRKRVLCAAAFIVFPLLLNGIRVYLTITVSYLTNMRFGPGTEHIMIGRIFVIAVFIALMWIGRRWHDAPVPHPAPVAAVVRERPSASDWVPLLLAMLGLFTGPVLLSNFAAQAKITAADSEHLIALPKGAHGWTGPHEDVYGWQPDFHGGLARKVASYREPQGPAVDIFVAVYGLGVTSGDEMISYSNVLAQVEHDSLIEQSLRELHLAGSSAFAIREVLLQTPTGERLVWQWFRIGGRDLTNAFKVKAFEALGMIARSTTTERVITLSTEYDIDARGRLQAYAQAHAACIAIGFEGRRCR